MTWRTTGVPLSADAHALVCALVAESQHVNADTVTAPVEVWEEVRTAFPVADFYGRLGQRDASIEYDPEGGEPPDEGVIPWADPNRPQ